MPGLFSFVEFVPCSVDLRSSLSAAEADSHLLPNVKQLQALWLVAELNHASCVYNISRIAAH